MAQAPKAPAATGYGSLIGLPKGVQNAEQLRAHKRKQDALLFGDRMKEAAAGMDPGNAQVFQQFAQLGNMLGKKLGGGKDSELTPEENQGLFAMEAANKNIAQLKESKEWESMDAAERGFAMQQATAQGLIQAGDTDTGYALAADAATKQANYRKTMAAAAELESETAARGAAKTPAEAAESVAKFHGELYNATERKQHRELMHSSDTMVKIADTMVKTFENATNPSDVVGTVGGMNSLVSGIGKLFEGGLRATRVFAGFDAEGNGLGPARTAEELLSQIPDSIVPAAIRNNAQQNAQYKSAVMQMVYADARLNEPGARQLSDADIKNAMDRLGVNNGDPQAVVDVFFNNMENRMDDMKLVFEDIGNTLEPVGGNAALKTVYGRDVLTDIESKRERLAAIRGRGQRRVSETQEDVTPGVRTEYTPEQQSIIDRYSSQ